ncbi:MAG: hypothetical protein ACXW4Q_03900 [Anaerolineales bacterium]
MKNLSSTAKVYISSTILIGLVLTVRTLVELDWANPGLYLLAVLGAVAQTLKVEGPNDRTNYSIAWFVYGFAFIAFGPGTALFVIVISHLAEWIWHKYPWYIQSFNIGNHVIAVFLAGLVFQTISQGSRVLDLHWTLGLVAANLLFVFGNHFLVGLVVKLARGQSFAESGVFGFLTLFLDFTILSMGAATALIWVSNPFAAVLNILPLYLLYHALRVPALMRQLQEMKKPSCKIPA